MELCAGLATPELKVTCFEAIIASSKPPQIREAEAVPEVAPTVNTTPAIAPAVDATPAVAPAVVAAPESSPAVAATSAATVTAVADSDFGQEHLDLPEEQEDEIFRATVTKVTRGHNKVLYFHLDNGHVWRQMEPRHFQYPKNGEFEINITRGMMGDYRLRIGDNGRMVRIRRVQ